MTARGIARTCGVVLLSVLLLPLLAWSVLALHFSNLPWAPLRTALAAAYGLAVVAAFALLPRRRRTLAWFLGSVAAIAAWWATIAPSNDRDWALPVAVPPRPELAGDRVTIRNVRDFVWRGPDDFDVRYADRTYDLAALDGLDVVLSYWDGNRDIAHLILVFGFADGERVAVSIETRPEAHETYSPLGGMFKQFELAYVIADERDVVQLRTNHRGEDVYLYPATFERPFVRALFERLLREAADVAERPRFYQALAHNCTTAWIALAQEAAGGKAVFDLRFLLNGRFDELLYERGRIVADATAGLPYEEMRARHAITAIARRHGGDPDFGAKVRAELPSRLGGSRTAR